MSRVCLLSQRFVRPEVSRCCVYEFEDVICQIDDVNIIAPRLGEFRQSTKTHNKFCRFLEKKLGVSLVFHPRPLPETLTEEAELFFVIVQDLNDLAILNSVPGWRNMCMHAVCWVEELWVSSLRWTEMLEPLQLFDHIILNCAQTVDALAKILQKPCHYIPPAVDTISFCPYPVCPHRFIDVYYMGRRSARAHEALYKAARKDELYYVFDTVKPEYVYDYAQHRFALAERVKRTHFFVANRAKIDSPEQTQGQHEVGFRFFEGAAGGAVLVGDPPETPEFREHFNWKDAIFPARFDSDEVLDVVRTLSGDPERLMRVQRLNARQSLLRHDWLYRWEAVLQLVGLHPSPESYERKRFLNELAGKIPC